MRIAFLAVREYSVEFGGGFMKQIVFAGILGGILLFSWGSLSHMGIGLGNTGIKELPEEQSVMSAMKSGIPQSGLYFFPGMHVAPNANVNQRTNAVKQFEQKYENGPYGILIYHPNGTNPTSPRKLGVEFGLNLAQALIAAFLVSRAKSLTGFHSRVGFVVLLGILAAISTNIEYWNWYGFPGNYTAAYMLDKIVGFLVVGIAIAAVMKRPESKAVPANQAA
jgi:lipopolysaccharide export LptBFGC system permease protein LptF